MFTIADATSADFLGIKVEADGLHAICFSIFFLRDDEQCEMEIPFFSSSK